MVKRISLYGLLLLSFIYCQPLAAQIRYLSPVFAGVDSVMNVSYGKAVNIKGQEENLSLELFTPPLGDTVRHRPLLIFIHGGGFVDNSGVGSFSSLICNYFARLGYVTASINYRLGVGETMSDKDYAEALYRAQQDGKGAVRYFRRYALRYGIDTSQIFIAGTEAGAAICLAMAYMDQNEVPAVINPSKLGTLEGGSGNEGYSSKVQGVLNCGGAMIDHHWIQSGDVPLFNMAGTADKTIAYDSSFAYHGFKYGSYILYQRCLEMGIPTCWKPFYGSENMLDNDKGKQDSCIHSMAAWLYTRLKAKGNYDPEDYARWESEIHVFDSLNSTEKYSDKAVMFLGSSSIRFWKHIKDDLGYPYIILRGFGGSNLADVAYFTKRILYPVQPRALFLYVANDIVGNAKDKTPDQVLELVKYIVKLAREKFPAMPIAWLAIFPNESRWKVWEKVKQANKLVKEFCESQTNLFYIDSADKFLGKDGRPIEKYYRNDKLHLTDAGYRVWGKNIARHVMKIVQ